MKVSFCLPGPMLDKVDRLAVETGCRRSDVLRDAVALVVDRTSLAAEVALRLADGGP